MSEKILSKFFFIGFSLFAIYLLVLCSEMPIIIENKFFKALFLRPEYNCDIYISFATSYLISVIFYLIVVFLPERKKKKDILPYIYITIGDIENLIKGMLHYLYKSTGMTNLPDFLSLDEQEIENMCQKANPKTTGGNIGNMFNYQQVSYAELISNSYYKIAKSNEKLMPYVYFLDSDIIKKINEIKNSTFSITISELDNISQLPKNNNLTPWTKEFKEFLKIYKELNKLTQSYNKKSRVKKRVLINHCVQKMIL